MGWGVNTPTHTPTQRIHSSIVRQPRALMSSPRNHRGQLEMPLRQRLVRRMTSPRNHRGQVGGDAAAVEAAAAEVGQNDQHKSSPGWLGTHSPAYSQATSGLRLWVDVQISFRLRNPGFLKRKEIRPRSTSFRPVVFSGRREVDRGRHPAGCLQILLVFLLCFVLDFLCFVFAGLAFALVCSVLLVLCHRGLQCHHLSGTPVRLNSCNTSIGYRGRLRLYRGRTNRRQIQLNVSRTYHVSSITCIRIFRGR
ncbi:hypothetical protein JB92DRAFT_1996976 [Gautieria morchelliformis]|nr:hypothetical protein JB92DRAFT_1996976 [Gautieria morchelliformis]